MIDFHECEVCGAKAALDFCAVCGSHQNCEDETWVLVGSGWPEEAIGPFFDVADADRFIEGDKYLESWAGIGPARNVTRTSPDRYYDSFAERRPGLSRDEYGLWHVEEGV